MRPPVSCREDNVAIARCRRFAGDVLIVESEKDEIVPRPVVASCLASLVAARSVSPISRSPALTSGGSRRDCDRMLSRWLREMIFGASS